MATSFDTPLQRHVPRLLTTEEKLFGLITVQQFLLDLCAGGGLYLLWTADLPLLVRAPLCLVGACLSFLAIHVRVAGLSLLTWSYLWLRLRYWVPAQAIWLSAGAEPLMQAHGHKTPAASVQQAWVQASHVHQGRIYIRETPATVKREARWRVTIVLQAKGMNLSMRSDEEQTRFLLGYEHFLLEPDFPHQVLLRIVRVARPLPVQRLLQHIRSLQQRQYPRLAERAKKHYRFLQQHTSSYLAERRYIIVSVSSHDLATAHAATGQSTGWRMLLALFLRLAGKHGQSVFDLVKVAEQAEIRAQVMREAFTSLGAEVSRLQDDALINLYRSTLAQGKVMLTPLSVQECSPLFAPHNARQAAAVKEASDQKRSTP